jgi:hypothetical protein
MAKTRAIDPLVWFAALGLGSFATLLGLVLVAAGDLGTPWRLLYAGLALLVTVVVVLVRAPPLAPVGPERAVRVVDQLATLANRAKPGAVADHLLEMARLAKSQLERIALLDAHQRSAELARALDELDRLAIAGESLLVGQLASADADADPFRAAIDRTDLLRAALATGPADLPMSGRPSDG